MTRADYMKVQQSNQDFFNNSAYLTPQTKKPRLPLMRFTSIEGHFSPLSEGKHATIDEQKDLLGDDFDFLNVEIGNALSEN